MKVTNPSDEYRDKYLELLIEKQLEKSYEKESYDKLIRKTIESISDTGQITNHKNKK